jgi:predicted phosphoribosyltransferase
MEVAMFTARTPANVFADRREAGRRLAQRLQQYANRDDAVVLALPRGGVPVGYEVARALGAPLDVYLVRKLGVPQYRELAMGAIASGGVRVLNEDVVRFYGIPPAVIDQVARDEQRELERREAAYRGQRAPLDVRGNIVILIDDGLATGSTMRAAVQALRARSPARIVVAVPVGAAETCDELLSMADVVVCVRTPQPFAAVGYWYQDFSETTDEEVQSLLREQAATRAQERSSHG